MNHTRHVSLWREGSLAAGLYFGATLVLTYPFSTRLATDVLPQGADTDLLLWLIAWDVHALWNPLTIFDANIYFPFRHTLAFAENIIGSGLIAAPIVWTTGNIVLALNVVSLLTFVLCGVGAYVLIRRLGFGPPAATLGGLIFAFAPPHFFRVGQLHLAAVQWIPFALAFLHEYLDTGQRRKLWWACGFFALQTLSSGHGAVFATISIALLLAWRFALGEPVRPLKRLWDLGVPGLLLLALAVSTLLPYRAAQAEVGLRRTLSDAYTWSPNPATLLASPTHVHAWILSQWSTWPVLAEAKAFLFPGYLALLLGLAGVWTLRSVPAGNATPDHRATLWTRVAFALEVLLVLSLVVAAAATLTGGLRWRFYGTLIFSARNAWRPWILVAVIAALRFALRGRAPLAFGRRLSRGWSRYRLWSNTHRRSVVAFYALLAVVTFWLSLGPEYWLYWFVYDLPGFNFIRVPTRYTLATLLALAVLAAAGFEWATRRFTPQRRTTTAVVVGALMLVEYAAMPLESAPYRVEVPAVDQWLAAQPGKFVVAELPMGDPADLAGSERRQSIFMLHSTAHWQKTIHGYSGVRPALHAELFWQLIGFPDEPSLLGLTHVGVTYVVVHTDFYPPGEWARVEARLARFKDWLTLEHVEGAGRVYKLYKPTADVRLRNRYAEYVEALTTGDTATLATFYLPDAVLVRPEGRILRGRLNIADWLQQNRAEALSVSLDTARFDFYSGTVTGAFTQSAGEAVRRGDYLQAWRLVEDRWMLASDVVSVANTRP